MDETEENQAYVLVEYASKNDPQVYLHVIDRHAKRSIRAVSPHITSEILEIHYDRYKVQVRGS